MSQPQPYTPRHHQPGHDQYSRVQPDYGLPVQGPPGYGTPGNAMAPYTPAGPPDYRPGPSVRPRGRALGAVVSIFLPGVGSMINGSAGRGSIILIAYVIACLLCLVLHRVHPRPCSLGLGDYRWGAVSRPLEPQPRHHQLTIK